jgi:hypothetical protein
VTEALREIARVVKGGAVHAEEEEAHDPREDWAP